VVICLYSVFTDGVRKLRAPSFSAPFAEKDGKAMSLFFCPITRSIAEHKVRHQRRLLPAAIPKPRGSALRDLLAILGFR